MSIDARRMFELTEPIGVIPYAAPEPMEALRALGYHNVWDCYFAGRAAPLGVVPAEVVNAIFYSFAPGEAARHIPHVWDIASPARAHAARHQGSVAVLQRALGDRAEKPGLIRAADLATKAAFGAATEGRPLYAALRGLPVPEEPLDRLFHAATLLREHRGDGHNAALMLAGIGGVESHVLRALHEGARPGDDGRLHHLPAAQLSAVLDGMYDRGLVDATGALSDVGREAKRWVEARTDQLAAPPYETLDATELDELIDELTPISAALTVSGIG